MRAVLVVLALLLLACGPALAHGGALTIRYVAGTHVAAPGEPAACAPTPLHLYGIRQHVGGACEMEVHHARVAVEASADEGDGTFFWRGVTSDLATCSEGSFRDVASFVLPESCARFSVYAPAGSAGGLIRVTQS